MLSISKLPQTNLLQNQNEAEIMFIVRFIMIIIVIIFIIFISNIVIIIIIFMIAIKWGK